MKEETALRTDLVDIQGTRQIAVPSPLSSHPSNRRLFPTIAASPSYRGIMAQGPVTPSRKLSKEMKGMKTVKKKLNDLKILCGTEAFLIYSCCDGLESVPKQLHRLLPLVEKYESCIKSGLHKMHDVPNLKEPLPVETTSLDLIQASSKQDHELLRIGWYGEGDDVKPNSEASKPHEDEDDLLLAMLNSLTGKNDLDSFSIEELQEIFDEIDSRVKATQSNLKPPDLLGKFSEYIEYEKEIENGQNEKSHASFKQQHQLPSLLGNLASETKDDAEIENKIPQSATSRGGVSDMVQDYPLWQSSKENFRYILSGEQLESLEVRCKLPKGIYEEQQNEVHRGTGNWEKSTMEQCSPLKEEQGVAGNNKGEKMDQVPCLIRDGDKLRLFLSGEQIDSLEVVGRFSTKVQNEQERVELSLELTL